MFTNQLDPNGWLPTHVYYHHPCPDGMTSAYLIRKWFKGNSLKIPVFIPATYGTKGLDRTLLKKGKSRVLMVDFSLKRDQLIDLADYAGSLVVIDHHISAREELEDFVVFGRPEKFFDSLSPVADGDPQEKAVQPIAAHFDMKYSGAGLTHQWLYGISKPMGALVDYIQDRDLWNLKLSHSNAVFLYITSFPYSFRAWEQMERDFNYSLLDVVLPQGEAMLRYYNRQVQELKSLVNMEDIGGYTVPVVNCNYLFCSSLGEELLKDYKDADFVACYYIKDHKRYFSLRSDNSRVDVSKVAAKLGGGGHRNAAGFVGYTNQDTDPSPLANEVNKPTDTYN